MLRARAHEVPADQLGSPALLALVDRMITAMRAAPGVGLAAPQLGEPWRVIVLEDRPELMAMASPSELAEREFEAANEMYLSPLPLESLLRTDGHQRARDVGGRPQSEVQCRSMKVHRSSCKWHEARP